MSKQPIPQELFKQKVIEALEHYHDPEWLGANSPLATAYFLGDWMRQISPANTRNERGNALRKLLYTTATVLWDGSVPQVRDTLVADAIYDLNMEGVTASRRLKFLWMELLYFRHYFPRKDRASRAIFPKRLEDYLEILTISRSSYHRVRKDCQAKFTELLLIHARPTFHLESLYSVEHAIGREDKLGEVNAKLKSGQSVSITGIGGVGKTTFAQLLSAQWSSAFWFTFRVGINDRVMSLLFSIAHFLHSKLTQLAVSDAQGSNASTLWLQLLAQDDRKLDHGVLVGLLRADLLRLQQHMPILLCFDEVDVLMDRLDEQIEPHSQILELLEDVAQHTPCMFVGQHAPLITDTHYLLQGLSLPEVSQVAASKPFSVPDDLVAQIFDVTQGNPRLLDLTFALLAKEEDAGEVIADLAAQPSVRPLLDRLWKRLNQVERNILKLLAVLEAPIAADDIPFENKHIIELIDKNVIKVGLQDQLSLLPLIGRLIEARLTPEQHDRVREQAARLRIQVGEYTEAMQLYAALGDYSTAVSIWEQHSKLEIKRGMAEKAQQVFAQISANRVPIEVRKRFFVERQKLNLLSGMAQEAIADIELIDWKGDEAVDIEHEGIAAIAHRVLGNEQSALKHYERRIDLLARTANQQVHAHTQRAQFYLEQAETGLAEKDMDAAEYEVSLVRGILANHQGRHTEAQQQFQSALTKAQSLSDRGRIARVYRELGLIAGRLGEMTQVKQYADRAIEMYLQLGNKFFG